MAFALFWHDVCMGRKITHLAAILLVGVVGCTPRLAQGSLTASPSLPSATSTRAATIAQPTPDHDSGVVVGQLVLRASGSPLALQTVYLGETLPLEPGPGHLIVLREKESPHATTDNEGRFVLANVSPGAYVLIIWTPFQSRVVANMDTGKEFNVTVRAGGTVDIGEVVVDWP